MAATQPALAAHAWLFVDRWDEESGNRAIAEAGRQGFAAIEIPIQRNQAMRTSSHRMALSRANIAALCRTALPNGLQMVRAPERTFHHVRRAIYTAAALESRLLVASFSWWPRGAAEGQPSRADRALVVEVMAALAGESGALGITLALEPGNRFETSLCNTVADAAAVALTVASPALKVAADTRTMLMEEANLRTPLIGAAELLASLTVRESHGGEAGTGVIPWEDVWDALARIGYDGWLVYRCDMAPTSTTPPEAQVWRRDLRPGAAAASAGLSFMRDGVKRMLGASATPDPVAPVPAAPPGPVADAPPPKRSKPRKPKSDATGNPPAAGKAATEGKANTTDVRASRPATPHTGKSYRTRPGRRS